LRHAVSRLLEQVSRTGIWSFPIMRLNSFHTRRSGAASLPAALRIFKTDILSGFISLLLLVAGPWAQAQNATYAGSERTVFSDASATPSGVAVDFNAVVYIADQTNARVLKETLSGGSYVQTTVGPATGALTFTPAAVAVDTALNVYISDAANGRVLKESWTGSGYTEAAVMTGLFHPTAIAVDAAQNIYVLNYTGSNWQVVLDAYSAGSYAAPMALTSIPSGGAYPLGNPLGIAVDASGTLYITDNGNGWVLMATYGGSADSYSLSLVAFAGGGSVAGGDMAGIAVDASGKLYITGENGGGYDPLYLETPAGAYFVETEIASTQLASPSAVAIGTNGHIYLADTGNTRVIEEIPSAAANIGTVAVGTPSAAATMLFAFTGIQTGITPSVLAQGTPGLEFADAGSGTCTSNGAGFTYDTTTGTNYRDGRNLFCSINVVLNAAFPGGRFGAASLVQSGAPIATGFAHGYGTGPQVAFANPPQTQIATSLTTEQGIASDSAGNLYIVDHGTGGIHVVTPGGAIAPLPTTAVLNPTSVAVDGAGNVYIADDGTNHIYKETLIAGAPGSGTYSESAIATSTLSAPDGVAVSGGGNLYIADYGTGLVLKETLTASGYTETTVTSSAPHPLGIAVDGNGNVYVTDGSGSRVLKETPTAGSYVETTIVSSVAAPSGIAVDGGGNLFLTDAATGNILLESLSGGSYLESVLGTSLTNVPTGVAVDGVGDAFYIAQSVNQLTRSVPTVLGTFPSTQVGQASSAQSFAVQNIGNAALSFTVPGTGSNPVLDTDFSDTVSGNSTCPIVTSSPETLAAGSSCLYSVEFTPTTTGSLSTSMTVLDDSLNAPGATQTVSLSGTALLGTDVIAFPVADQTYGVAPFAVAATSNSTGTFTYAVVSGPATISGSTVTITGAGSVTLSATQAADVSYAAGTQNVTFNVLPEIPTLAFTVPNQTFGVAPFTLTASSASTGAITYALVSGPATLSGATVTLTGAGTVVLSASQAADANYTAVAAQNTSFTVAPGTPTLAFTVPNQTFGAAPFTLTASSASTGAITYALVSGPATLSGATVTLTGAGTVVLSAAQAADANYTAVAAQNTSFTVAPGTPTLVFTVPNQTFGAAPFTVTASSASTGAITYALVSGPATVSGSTVTLTGAGTVVLSASQAADANYTAVAAQNTSFTVAPGTPTLAFTVPNQTFGAAPFTVAASSNSTGTFTYAVVTGPATISGSTVTITGAGSVTLSVTQAANGNYAADTQNVTFAVAAEVPTLAFTVPDQTFGAEPFSVAAISASTGTITYAVVSGPASISGSTVTLTGTGSVTLSASQAANGNFASGVQNATFNVALEVPTLTFSVANQTFGVAPFSVAAISGSTGTITYAVVSGPASISGSTITITGAGSVTLSASQAANGNYAAGVQNATFNVALEVPSLTFSVANQTFGVAPFSVAATSASTGTITYAVVSGPATISGATVTVTGAGTVTLSATQAANGNYAAGVQNATFSVGLQTPALVFAAIAAQNTDSLPFLISASSASTGAIAYTVVSGPATLTGATVTLTGAGTVVLSATQAAAGNYAATIATTTFTVTNGFTITPVTGSSTAATTTPGGAATYNISLTPGTGSTFADALTLTISGLPTGATATFSPASIAAGTGATAVKLTVQTSNQASNRDLSFPFKPTLPILLGLMLPLLGTKRARRRLLRCSPLVLMILLGGVMALAGCGTSSPSYPPAQTYTMVVTATDTTTGAHTATNLTLTVQ
jgi:sugar lactone lactonase YvrE